MKAITGYRKKVGAALAVVMMLISIMTLAGISLLGLSYHMRIRAIREGQSVASKCAADAAIAQVIYLVTQMAEAESWTDIAPATDVALPGTEAIYDYTVSGNPFTGVDIMGVGKCGISQKTVHCTVKSYANMRGLTAEARVKFESNLIVDGVGATILTNSSGDGAISIEKGTVSANLIGGPSGDLDKLFAVDEGKVALNGSKTIALKKTDFPAVEVPLSLMGLPANPKPAGTTVIPANALPTSYKYLGMGALTIRSPNNVTLYIDGSLDVGNGGDIIVEDGATLTMYVDGDVIGKNGVGITSNVTDDPVKVAQSITILGTEKCTKVELKNSASAYALLYAPSADIEFKNGASLHGAVVGKTIGAKNNAEFHYIKELRNATGIPATVIMVERWWE